MRTDDYYLQDSRTYVGNDVLWCTYVGNDVLWWKVGDSGYTTDLRQAKVFSREEALRQNTIRSTDIPWPKYYIDHISRPAVDFQRLNHDPKLTEEEA